MTRIDRLVLRRLAGRVALAIVVLFALIALAESLNTWRFQHLAVLGGPLLGLLAIAIEALRWTLGTLPVILLIGAIIGILDLQARRELTIIKSTGYSIWRILFVPGAAVVVFALFASLVVDTAIVTVSRGLSVSMPEASSAEGLWLEQDAVDQHYVIKAEHAHSRGTVLENVTVFLDPAAGGGRITADRLALEGGAWVVGAGALYRPDVPPQRVDGLQLPTTTTAGDLGVKLASPSEMTIFELFDVLGDQLSDRQLRSGVEMRFLRLLALPLLLVGCLLIAFAFTAGYRRTNKYGVAVLYGIVLGFVVYVITEMMAMAGGAGMLEPSFAAIAPAFVAIVIGATVLLFKEDGWTA